MSPRFKPSLRSVLCPRRRRRRHGSCRLDPTHLAYKSHQANERQSMERVTPTAEQKGSSFLQRLPVEIRRMIYTLIWEHHDRQYHLSLADGRLRRLKCVKHCSDDEDDAIQKAMDMAYASESSAMVKDVQLQLWQRRLASSWGHRHWRCEEWLDSCPSYAERTMFQPMMLVCKRMYPEIMESIFESHMFLFNDMASAYHFFVTAPSPFIGCIRSLDVSLVLPYAEYRPCSRQDGPQPTATKLEALQKSLTKITFRDLRISLDVLDRQCWRKVPATGILQSFGQFKVLNECIVELPALFPGENEQPEDLDMGSSTFRICRRPPIRYWNFNPRRIERLTWNAAKGTTAACWITSDTMGYIPNPWHDTL